MSLNTCIYLETITTIKAINIYHLQKFPWPPPNIFFFVVRTLHMVPVLLHIFHVHSTVSLTIGVMSYRSLELTDLAS